MKKWKAILLICVFCVCLTPCMAVTSLADAIIDWYQNDQWYADYDIEVTDPDGYVNIRSGPGTNYDILTTAPTGTVLHVSTEGLASDGATWCQISYNGYTGWLALSRATVVDTAEATPEPTAAPTPTPTPEVTATPEATAAPEVTATPAPAAVEEPAGAENDPASSKTEALKDIVLQTEPAAAETAQVSSSRNTTILLVIFILLVVLVIVIAVLLIVLLRKTR